MSYTPSNIQLGRPAVFCFDNNDILEKELSGKSSTHCTSGILVQNSAGAVIVEPDNVRGWNSNALVS